MKLKEFFTYLNPYECISIVDEYGYVVTPINYRDLKYTDIYECLDLEVLQIGYDKDDDSLTITIDAIAEQDEDDD